MTMLLAESFDKVSVTTLAQRWSFTYVNSSFISVSSSTGRNGGNGVGFTTTGTSVGLTISTGSTRDTGTCHWWGSVASQNQRWIGFGDATVTHIYLLLNTSNKIEVYQGNGTLLGTSSSVITGTVHFQIKIKVANSGGTVELKINDVTEVTVGSADTQNGGTAVFSHIRVGQVAPGTGNGGTPVSLDDLVFNDDQGSVNNGFLGDVRVQALTPTGTGNSAQFTPSTGSNWQNVDEATSNSDTDYNSSSTANHIDSFATGDLTPTAGTIYAVIGTFFARSDDAGSHTIKPLVRISSTDYPLGSGTSVSSSYACGNSIQETSPATSSAWSISEVNGMETGYKLIS